MSAWLRTTTPEHADLPMVRHAFAHLRGQFPMLTVAVGLTALGVAMALFAVAGAVTPVALATAAAGALGVVAGLGFRPRQLELAPTTPPLSGLVRTGSISSDVLLDYDRGTAEKVYRPTRPVKLLYVLSFQARFPYTDNEPAFEAARLRREIAGLLSEAWFGENMVSPTLEVRPNGDGRFVFVTELVRGTAPRDKERARSFLSALAERFNESGLPLWQVAPYNPRAIGNLIERTDGSYRIIDLESNLVTPFLSPGALVRAIRAGLYPSFDEIDTARLRAYVGDNHDMLTSTVGSAKAARLAAATDEYAAAQTAWHQSEPRIASKALRFALRLVDVPSWLRAMRRLTAGGERLAASVTNTGIDTWVAEGTLTPAEAETARAQLATPEMTAATASLGAHLAITVPLRFPFGSIARTFWTLALRAKGEWDGIQGKAPAEGARRVHSLPVAALAFIPGFGSFAYLASKPFRQEPVIRAVAFDQALRHSPLRGYERLHLGALTRSMARPAPARERSLGRWLLSAAPVTVLAALLAGAATATFMMADPSGLALQASGGTTIALAGAASLFAFRSFWKGGADRPVSEQAGSFLWLLAGAGLIALGLDLGLGIHEAAASALDGLGLPMVPGGEEAHVVVLVAYAATAAVTAYAFRGEVMSGRPSASLVVVGGALAAGALGYEAITGDAGFGALTASGLMILAATTARAVETRRAGDARRLAIAGDRLPDAMERLLAALEPSLREVSRTRDLGLKLLALSAIVVAMSVAIGRTAFGAGEEHQLFRDFGPVTIMSSVLLVLGGGLGLAAWRRDRIRSGRPFYGDLWAAWGLGFVLLAVEQPFDVHGRVGGLISMLTPIDRPLGFDATSDAIVAVYGVAGVAVTAVLAKQLLEQPRALLRFAAAVPAVGLTIAIDGFFGHSAFMWVCEESVELVAASFFVAGFAERYRRSTGEAVAQRSKLDAPQALAAAA